VTGCHIGLFFTTDHQAFASCAPFNAYNSRGWPALSQLANFHQLPYQLPTTLTIIHRIGPGIGGQFAHMPPSAVLSKFNKKNGNTSVMPALLTVFLPHVLNIAEAESWAGVEGAGTFGWLARAAMMTISWWKWCSKGVLKESMMRTRDGPENSEGFERDVR
jgi:hypothetical protein